MRLLVISNTEWDDSNSFGNTFSNLLSFESPSNIANIYCRNGSPNTSCCGNFLSMGERDVINRILRKGDFPQTASINGNDSPVVNNKCGLLNRFVRSHRWTIFFWIRELLWILCPWKGSSSLHAFIEEFSPELIILPTYQYSYINKLAIYLSNSYGLPIVSYISDDEYSLNQRSFSPLFWINRFYQRRWVKKGFDKSAILYTISNIQNEYFRQIVKCPCKVLTKGLVFCGEIPFVKSLNNPIKILYVGNIGCGRWRSLKLLAEEVGKLNVGNHLFEFDIYTASPITYEIGKSFTQEGVKLNGPVVSSEVKNLIKKSDILVHAESFRKSDKLAVKQSFSTKIVDYLHSGKCIFGIGPADVASIDFLLRNDAAIIADCPSKVGYIINEILNNPSLLRDHVFNAWQTGKKLCDINTIHMMLKNDFKRVIDKSRC